MAVPDWLSLINNDPGLLAYRGGETQALNNAATSRSAALRALAVRNGGLPAGFHDPYGDITPETNDLAQHNQFSTVAQLQRQRGADTSALTNSLAARGALHSGAYLGGMNRLNTDYGQREYDAGNSFADQYSQHLQDYASQIGQQKQGEASAISSAAQNVYNNPANRSMAVAATGPPPGVGPTVTPAQAQIRRARATGFATPWHQAAL